MRRAPIRPKRLTPRRNDGRVTHGRIKVRNVEPNAEQRAYWKWLREHFCCEGCGRRRALVIHHILPSSARDHWRVVILCPGCHNGRTDSVHLLGSEAKFLERHGVDLVAVSVARLEEYRRVE